MIHLFARVAIASTVIGYPQGLCDPTCTCGVCESISGHLHQDVNYSNIKDSCSSIETSGDSAIAGFIPCEGSGGGNRGSVRSGAIVGGSCNGIEVVTPEVCSTRNSGNRKSKAVLSNLNETSHELRYLMDGFDFYLVQQLGKLIEGRSEQTWQT